MRKVNIKLASNKDESTVIAIDYALDKYEHVKLRRKEKIRQAILNNECLIICEEDNTVGFVIFNYHFFDQGWIELLIIKEEYTGKGIGTQVLDLICRQCKTDKIFTSTNNSNFRMQKALAKADFIFAGELDGLDDGDPELFYYKKRTAIV